jgi:hypothetical protein
MLTIAHIVNPVVVPKSSDLFIAQPITFETMRMARDFSQPSVKVSLFSAQYPEDRPLIPSYLTMTRDLDRSILDVEKIAGNRKLPLIKDILARLYEASNADYFVYTNVDIGLKQEFYLAVSQYIEEGYDAFSITRRTISERFQAIEEIPQMYLEIGEPHRGFDCFVFRRSLYPQFDLGNVCLGVPPIGRVLICNCIRYANQFRIFRDKHLTFHIGNDGVWKDKKIDYARIINTRSGLEIVKNLYRSTNDNNRKSLLKPDLDKLIVRNRRLNWQISPLNRTFQSVKKVINKQTG